MIERSRKILYGSENQYYRATWKSMGFSSGDLQRPMIGIANAWSECVPGHYNLRQLAQRVKDGIYRAGGTPVEFGVIGGCDGMAQGHNGMHYILPSRELVADSIEAMAQIHLFDGLVLMGSCDKIVPGMLMAAVRLDLPCLLFPGGPMEGGIEFDGRKSDQTSNTEAYGMLMAGRITREEYEILENSSCPTCGSCAYLGTANTMCILSEALGMTPPDAGTLPATASARLAAAQEAGMSIVKLVRQGITARKIVTSDSIRNAIRVCLAMSGSTNAVLHLTAIAAEAELDIQVLEEFDRLSRTTPILAQINPASPYNMTDFYQAGGVMCLMKEMLPILSPEICTVTGHTLRENLEKRRTMSAQSGHPDIIRTLKDPFDSTGGIAVLRGNLAPNTGITKPGAFAAELRHFIGPAICFDSEEDAEAAILSGMICPGQVIVIRYEGPKGGPGMREMFRAMKYLYGRGLAHVTAMITDGRFSGTNNGCFVGHISPEAAEGGPIALVKDGDMIEIDVERRRLSLLVSESELKHRKELWKKPIPKYKRGYLAKYSRIASSANEGAILKE